MIQQAVILAAGRGTRIRQDADALPKPLHEVQGEPLLLRVVRTLGAAGITDVTVVIGFMGDAIRKAVAGHPGFSKSGVAVHFVENPEYDLQNGVSVLAVRGHVHGPFVLSMADHVYDARVARIAAGADMGAAGLWLCVDRRVDDVYDIDDATKVRTEEDSIVDIGKTLDDYDCIDTGVFAVSPELLDALEAERGARGDCSLSDGVRRLSRTGRARVLDIGDAFWQDVDTPGALERAEDQLGKRRR